MGNPNQVPHFHLVPLFVMPKQKRRHKILRSPPPHLGPGDSGAWSPGGSPGSGAGIASVISFLIKADAASALERLNAMPRHKNSIGIWEIDNPLPVVPWPPNMHKILDSVNVPMHRANKDYIDIGKVKQVPISDLVTFQKNVWVPNVEHFIKGGKAAPRWKDIIVLSYKGKLYLYDGNHRVVAAYLDHQPTIEAVVVDLDNPPVIPSVTTSQHSPSSHPDTDAAVASIISFLTRRSGLSLFEHPITTGGTPRECYENARREYWALKQKGLDPTYYVGSVSGSYPYTWRGSSGLIHDTEHFSDVPHAWIKADGKVYDPTPFKYGKGDFKSLPEKLPLDLFTSVDYKPQRVVPESELTKPLSYFPKASSDLVADVDQAMARLNALTRDRVSPKGRAVSGGVVPNQVKVSRWPTGLNQKIDDYLFYQTYRKNKSHLDIGTLTLVPIADLVSNQKDVYYKNVAYFIQGGKPGPRHEHILVGSYRGRLYLINGNNRTSAAALMGKSTVEAVVIPIPEDQSYKSSILDASAHSAELRRWVSLSYPEPAQHSYTRNIMDRSLHGETSPWFNVQYRPSGRSDQITLHGEIGKGSFLLNFRIKDGETSFTLTEEKVASRARILVGEYVNQTGRQFPIEQVLLKAHYLSDLTRKAVLRWKETHH